MARERRESNRGTGTRSPGSSPEGEGPGAPEVGFLCALASLIDESPDLDRIFASALEAAATYLRFAAGTVHVLDEGSDTLRLAAHRGLPEALVAIVRELPLGRAMAGRAALAGEPLVLTDMADYPDPDLAPLVRGQGWHHIIAIPLAHRSQVLGVVSLAGREPRQWPPYGIAFLTAVGKQIGTAIGIARHSEEIRRLVELRGGTIGPHPVGGDARAGSPPASVAPTILVADDERMIREMIAGILTRTGYHVQAARDGQEALALVGQASPSLLILDLYMPKVDGLKIIRRLRADARTQAIPILVITAARASEAMDAWALGGDLCLLKPFSPANLLEAVERLLADRQSQLGVEGRAERVA